MATDHNFRIKNGLEVGGSVIVNSSGQLVVANIVANQKFHDDVKLNFGNNNDLQIYHDPNNSFILHNNTSGYFKIGAGTNSLFLHGDRVDLRSETGNDSMLQAFRDGAVKLYYNAVERVSTTSGGAQVTGDLSVSGNLYITGDINSTSVTDLDVADKTITMAVGSGSSTAADGGGIIIEGPTSGASLLWNHGNQQLRFNKDVFTPAGFIIGTTSTNVGKMYNSSGVMALEAYSSRSISFGNATNGEHVRIDASGNIGVGINAPVNYSSGARTLHINDATLPEIRFTNNTTGTGTGHGMLFQQAGNDFLIFNAENGNIITYTGANERMRITSAGVVDIAGPTKLGSGTYTASTDAFDSALVIDQTKPIYSLNPDGNYLRNVFYHHTNGNFIFGQQGTSLIADMVFYPGSSGNFRVFASGTEDFRINSSGNVGIGTLTPQGKLDVDGDLRITRNIVSNTVYQMLSFGSDRGIDDYGGANKDYWRINLATPGSSTDGGSSAHAYGTLIFSGVTGSNTTYADRLAITAGGNVGIGTNTPSSSLSVAGTGNITGKFAVGATAVHGSYDFYNQNTAYFNGAVTVDDTLTANAITMSSGGVLTQTVASSGGVYHSINHTGNENWSWAAQSGSSSTDYVDFGIAGGTRCMTWQDDGSVGIGTTAPSAKLEINNTGGTRVKINSPDGGGAPALTSRLEIYGYEGRGAGIEIRDSVNSASSANNREWFVGSGYGQSGFNIGYASDGVQSSYSAQNKLTINVSGQVGIGTAAPAYPLEVQGAGTVTIAYQRTGVSGPKKWGFHSDSSNTYWQNITDNVLALTIANAGNVGIGTLGPSGKLHIKGTTATSDASHVLFENTQGSKVFAIGGGSTGVTNNNLFFRNVTDNTRPMVITDAGNVGINKDAPRGSLEIHNTGTTSDGDGTANMNMTGSDSIILYGHGSTNGQTYGNIVWTDGGNRRRAMIASVAENTDQDHVGLVFYTQGTDGAGDFEESMRISRNGKVGIGKTASANLDVAGTIAASSHISATDFRPTNIVTNKVVKFNGTQLDDSNITDTGSLVTIDSRSIIKGQATTGSNFALQVQQSNGQRLQYWREDGVVSTEGPSYFYVQNTQGMYVSHHARFRGGISNDQGNLALSDSVDITGTLTVGNTTTAQAVQLFVGSNDVATDNTGLTFTLSGSYSDGRYEHRFRKRDEGGGIPLYIDKTSATANDHTQIARFGSYTNNADEFEVYGGAKVSSLTSSGSVNLTAGQLKLRSDVALDHDGSSLYIKAPSLIYFYPGNTNHGNINTAGTLTVKAYQVNGTTVINSSRNLSNIGTINSTYLAANSTEVAASRHIRVEHEGGGGATTGGIFLEAHYSGSDILGSLSSEYSSGEPMFGSGMAYKSGGAGVVSTFDNFSDERSGVKVNRGTIAFTGTASAVQTTVGSALTVVDTLIHNTTNGETTTTGGLTLGGGHIQQNNASEIRGKDTSGNVKTLMRVNSSNQLEYGWSGNGPVKIMGGGSYTTRITIGTDGNTAVSGNLSSSGNMTVGGDLTVNGTTTTINATNLNVEDKNITLNYGTGNTSSSADGAGITIQDAVDGSTDASLTWRASDDKFIFSHKLRMFNNFELPDNVKLVAGDSEDLQIFHDGYHSEIREQGTGDLRIRGNSVWVLNSSGQNQISASGGVAKLYCSGNEKLATASDGIDVTGRATIKGTTGLYLHTAADAFRAAFHDNGTKTRIFADGDGTNSHLTFDGGNVGVGVDSPSNKLSVSGVITSGNFTAAGVGNTPGDANTAEIGPGYINLARDDTASAKQILFGKNGTVHSFLETTSSGLNIGGANVGISTAPTHKLHVAGDIRINNGGALKLYNSAGNAWAEIKYNNSLDHVEIQRSFQSATDNYYNLGSTGKKWGNVYAKYSHATEGFTSDFTARQTVWRAVDNSASSGTRYVKICRITASQSSRFSIELTGRSTGYGDGNHAAFGRLIGQLNNDNNYDLTYYDHKTGSSEVVVGIGQVDVDTASTDIYVQITSFAEIVAVGVISDGTIFPTTGNTGTAQGVGSAPTGYTAVTKQRVIIENASGNVGIGTSTPTSKLSTVGTIRSEGMSTITGGGVGTEVRYDVSGGYGGIIAYDRGNSAYKELRVEGSIIKFKESGADVMTIDGNKVGIGTTSPGTSLQIGDGTGDEYITIDKSATGASGILFKNAGNNKVKLLCNSSEEFELHVNNALAMYVKESRFVGIGTSSPLDLLHLKSSSTDARQIIDGHTGYDAELKFAENGTVKYTVGHDAASDNFVIGTTNVDTQQRFVINSSGNVGIGTTSILSGVKLDVRGGNIHVGGYGSGADYGIRYSAPDGSSHWYTYADTGGELVFGRSGTIGSEEKIRFDASGYVGIGTNNPEAPLHVDKAGVALGSQPSNAAIFDSTGTDGVAQIRVQHLTASGAAALGAGIEFKVGDGTSGSNTKSSYIRQRGGGQLSMDYIADKNMHFYVDHHDNDLTGTTYSDRGSLAFEIKESGEVEPKYDLNVVGNIKQNGTTIVDTSKRVYTSSALYFNSANNSSLIAVDSTVNLKYMADGKHIFQTYLGGWGTRAEINDSGLNMASGTDIQHNGTTVLNGSRYIGNVDRVYLGSTNNFNGSFITGDASNIMLNPGTAERIRINSPGTIYQRCTTPTLHQAVTGMVFENGSLITDVTRASGKSMTLAQNMAVDTGNTWAYLATGVGSYYQQFNGAHIFGYAASGSAGTDATVNTMAKITTAGAIIAKDDVTAFGSFSDKRLKENIKTIDKPIEKLMTLSGVTFNYIDSGKKSTGLIAQDLEEVLPEAVYETENIGAPPAEDPANDKGENKVKAIRYGNTVGLLVEAIKEQQSIINRLEKRIKTLEGKKNGNK